MPSIEFELDTRQLECSYQVSEIGSLSCTLTDREGIEKEAENVSFLSIEPTVPYRSSLYYKNLNTVTEKTFTFTYEFGAPVRCRVQGNDTTATIRCDTTLPNL